MTCHINADQGGSSSGSHDFRILTAMLLRMVDAGHSGRKTGRGLYAYESAAIVEAAG